MSDRRLIRTFSGTHSWHPSVLADTDADEAGTAPDIIEAIESGRCPRCEGALPVPPEVPTGSRITKCRSIPICRQCGEDEGYEALDQGISSAGCWPLKPAEIAERKTRYEARMTAGFITSDGMERTLGIAIENMEDHRLATVAEALHHAQAAEKAMDTLRPYLDSRGQFVADIVHAATVGIGKLTVPDLYQAGAR